MATTVTVRDVELDTGLHGVSVAQTDPPHSPLLPLLPLQTEGPHPVALLPLQTLPSCLQLQLCPQGLGQPVSVPFSHCRNFVFHPRVAQGLSAVINYRRFFILLLTDKNYVHDSF